MMRSIPKRQRIEKTGNIKLLYWNIIFFGNALSCDMPILESLYFTSFILTIDLFTRSAPSLLLDRIVQDPHHYQLHRQVWWERFKSLINPLLNQLFPTGSLFRQLKVWTNCLCCPKVDENRVHYPRYFVEDDSWSLTCAPTLYDFSRNCDPTTAILRTAVISILKGRPKLYYHHNFIYKSGQKVERLTTTAPGFYDPEEIILDIANGHLDTGFRKRGFAFRFEELCLVMMCPEVIEVKPNISSPFSHF
jgi:hypothetical protein